MLSYEDRIKLIKKPQDIHTQIQESKEYCFQLRRQLKKAKTLDDRLGIHTKIVEAEGITNKLSRNIFNLEEKFTAAVTEAC